MNNDIKNFIINDLEPNIVSLFLVQGYGKLDKPREFKFDNFIPSELIINKVYHKANKILTDEFLKEFNSIFPKNFNTSINALKKRLERFIILTDVKDITPDEILEAARQHIGEHQIPYCGTIEYFIYKYNDNRVFSSRMANRILENRENNVPIYTGVRETSDTINSILDEL